MAEPFGLGEARRYDLERVAHEHGAVLRIGNLAETETNRNRVVTELGEAIDYELLVVAVGAEMRTSLPGAIMVQGPGYTGRFRTVSASARAEKAEAPHVRVPIGASWPLPLYELALLTATRVAERGLRKMELRLVTPEGAPLELFGGREASAAVAALLDERGIERTRGSHPSSVEEGASRSSGQSTVRFPPTRS